MKHYKDAQNQLFAYEADGSQDDFILPGLTPITDEEADALRASTPGPTPLQQIETLEREHLLPRATREFMLAFMEATAIQQGAGQGLTPEQSITALRAGNSGYRKVKELDEQIDALRAQL